jgi:hypothetical protein
VVGDPPRPTLTPVKGGGPVMTAGQWLYWLAAHGRTGEDGEDLGKLARKRQELIERARQANEEANNAAAGGGAGAPQPISPAAIAAAVREALEGLQLGGSLELDGTLDLNTGDVITNARNVTVRFIRDNPDSIKSRTSGRRTD